MTRKVSRFEVVCDTSLFTALQLQTRFFGQVGISGWARWLREHAVPFRQLISEHRLGVVVMAVSIEHLHPLNFFDADILEVVSVADVIRSGMVRLTSDIYAEKKLCAHSWCALRPVLIDGKDGSLAASPTRIQGNLLDFFLPANYLPEWSPPRSARDWSQRVSKEGQFLAEHQEHRMVSRHECEAADQWSFFEVPLMAAASRERMVQGKAWEVPKLQDGLSRTLKALYYEMSRPLFVFDQLVVGSRAYGYEGGLVCVHTITGATANRRQNAIIVEIFDH